MNIKSQEDCKYAPSRSVSSTTKNTPSASPKSPPNSPNVELSDFREFKDQLRQQGIFVNRCSEEQGFMGTFISVDMHGSVLELTRRGRPRW